MYKKVLTVVLSLTLVLLVPLQVMGFVDTTPMDNSNSIRNGNMPTIGEPIDVKNETVFEEKSVLSVKSFVDSANENLGQGHTPSEIISKYNLYKSQPVENEFIVHPSFTQPHVAGIPSDAIIQNGINTVNFMRFIAGLPDDVSINSQYAEMAQHGATLLADIGQGLSHFPEQPSDMEDSFYQLGRAGTSSSNIAAGYETIENSVSSYMLDGDAGNVDRVGHRRWILNPSMKETGLGYSYNPDSSYGRYYNLYAFDESRDFASYSNYDSIAWPAKGAFPIQYAKRILPWSITLNPSIYDNNRIDNIKVKVTNTKTGVSWESDPSKSYTPTALDEFFEVETSGYGVPFCIIFRPTFAQYDAGDVYDVEINGVYKSDSDTTCTIKYSTYFFDLENTDSYVATFADPGLEAAVRTAINKPAGEVILKSDVERITMLNATGCNISSLAGIENLPNLTYLNLENNKISDISSLSKLHNLSNLLLSKNNLSNLSPLKNMNSLDRLDISHNQITNITYLSELTNLTDLNISFNQIDNISSLEKLVALTQLIAERNNINDISPLSEMSALQSLFLGSNQIKDINSLSKLTNLIQFSIGANSQITDISVINNFPNLAYIDIVGLQVKDISFISKFDDLQVLYANQTGITDISALSKLTKLTLLALGGNTITDFSGLSKLTSLTYLDLSENHINNISSLKGLISLEQLYLASCDISNIDVIENFTHMKRLYLYINEITDIQVLSNLTDLTCLYMQCNKVKDISPLSNLKNLKELAIGENPIYDYTPLKDNYSNLSFKDFTLSKLTSININGADKINIPVNGMMTSQYNAVSEDQNGIAMDNLSVSWAVYDNTKNPVSTLSIDNTGLLKVYSTAIPNSYTIEARSKIDTSVCSTKSISLTPSIAAPQLTGFTWAQGSATGTTKATVVPAGTLKYIVGAAGSKVQPNVGDAATAYTNILTANTDIAISAGQHIFIIGVGSDGNIASWANIVVNTANIKPLPTAAPQLTEFTWTQGSTLGTTKATAVPTGTLKYIVGAAGSKVQPNVGDAATAYTNILTANADITVSIGQHIFIIALNSNGTITGWADVSVATTNINSTPIVTQPVVDVGGGGVIPGGGGMPPPVGGNVPPAATDLSPTNPTPKNGIVTVIPVVTNNIANAEISLADYKALFDSVTVTNGIKNLTINIDNNNLSTFNSQLPVTALNNSTKDVTTTINTAIAKVEIPSNMFDETTAKGAKNIGINIGKFDKSTLPADVADKIGNATVLDISATIDGAAKAWSNPNAPVKISIPYTLKEGENSNYITVYYIDGTGKLENMQGVYNSDTKSVTFSTTHFSKYFVKENKILFTDLAGYEQYTKYIEGMSSKGIIEGVGLNKYSPSKVLTRAEFATLLVKMLKLDTIKVNNEFTDVKSTDWYAPYVNAAYKAGLISGIGASKFAPNEIITNQDAAIILIKALKYKGLKTTSGSLTNVKDIEAINKYAQDSVGFAVSKGIISLDTDGNFNAKSTVNRAAAAEYIYNVFYFKN